MFLTRSVMPGGKHVDILAGKSSIEHGCLHDPVIPLEWRRLLDISLSQPEDESVEPSDPFMALKHAETAADDIAYSFNGWLHGASGCQGRFDGAMALEVTLSQGYFL